MPVQAAEIDVNRAKQAAVLLSTAREIMAAIWLNGVRKMSASCIGTEFPTKSTVRERRRRGCRGNCGRDHSNFNFSKEIGVAGFPFAPAERVGKSGEPVLREMRFVLSTTPGCAKLLTVNLCYSARAPVH